MKNINNFVLIMAGGVGSSFGGVYGGFVIFVIRNVFALSFS
jgi:hypothetical protein